MATEHSIGYFVETYGDLIFDLCYSILRNRAQAEDAFRSIIRKIKVLKKSDRFVKYERASILKITCDTLISTSQRHSRPITLLKHGTDKNHLGPERLDGYLQRLSTEDQLLLLLRDKLNIPNIEIAVALGDPEGSLQVRRQQALRSLEDWIWNEK